MEIITAGLEGKAVERVEICKRIELKCEAKDIGAGASCLKGCESVIGTSGSFGVGTRNKKDRTGRKKNAKPDKFLGLGRVRHFGCGKNEEIPESLSAAKMACQHFYHSLRPTLVGPQGPLAFDRDHLDSLSHQPTLHAFQEKPILRKPLFPAAGRGIMAAMGAVAQPDRATVS